MRHAKSSWKSGAPTDHARPLNKRGRRDAPRVGARLNALGWVPQVILSSDSERTRETLHRMRDDLGFAGRVRFDRDLYHAGTTEVVAALSDLESSVHTVMVLGHNPGWEEALAALSGREEVLKTGCAALLHRSLPEWVPTLADGDWTLETVVRPREL